MGSTVLRELRPSPNDDMSRRHRPLGAPTPAGVAATLLLLPATSAWLGSSASFRGFRPRSPGKKSMDKDRLMGSCTATPCLGNRHEPPA